MNLAKLATIGWAMKHRFDMIVERRAAIKFRGFEIVSLYVKMLKELHKEAGVSSELVAMPDGQEKADLITDLVNKGLDFWFGSENDIARGLLSRTDKEEHFNVEVFYFGKRDSREQYWYRVIEVARKRAPKHLRDVLDI